MRRTCRVLNCTHVTPLLFLMAVRVLQAVLREAEAVAHCHRVQVGAKREQVCISGLQFTTVFIIGIPFFFFFFTKRT